MTKPTTRKSKRAPKLHPVLARGEFKFALEMADQLFYRHGWDRRSTTLVADPVYFVDRVTWLDIRRPFGFIVASTALHLIHVGRDIPTGPNAGAVVYSSDESNAASMVMECYRMSGATPADKPSHPDVAAILFWDGFGLVACRTAADLDARLRDAEVAGLISQERAQAAHYAEQARKEYDGDGYWSTRASEHAANAERLVELRREIGVWRG